MVEDEELSERHKGSRINLPVAAAARLSAFSYVAGGSFDLVVLRFRALAGVPSSFQSSVPCEVNAGQFGFSPASCCSSSSSAAMPNVSRCVSSWSSVWAKQP